MEIKNLQNRLEGEVAQLNEAHSKTLEELAWKHHMAIEAVHSNASRDKKKLQMVSANWRESWLLPCHHGSSSGISSLPSSWDRASLCTSAYLALIILLPPPPKLMPHHTWLALSSRWGHGLLAQTTLSEPSQKTLCSGAFSSWDNCTNQEALIHLHRYLLSIASLSGTIVYVCVFLFSFLSPCEWYCQYCTVENCLTLGLDCGGITLPLAPSPTEEAVIRPITFLKGSSGHRCWVLRHVLAVVISSVLGMVVMCHALQLCFTNTFLVHPYDSWWLLHPVYWWVDALSHKQLIRAGWISDLSNHIAFKYPHANVC